MMGNLENDRLGIFFYNLKGSHAHEMKKKKM